MPPGQALLKRVTTECLPQLVNKANLVHNLFFIYLFDSVFISLYMFRATMCPPSGETTVFVRYLVLVILKQVKVKSKAVSLQAWSGPEGSRKLRFPDYMKTAQDGSKFVSPTHRPPLPQGNAPGTHFR